MHVTRSALHTLEFMLQKRVPCTCTLVDQAA